MKKIIISIVLVAVIAMGVGVWYFFFRGESLNVSTTNIDSSQKAKSIEERDSADGSWEISPQDDVFAGYSINEVFGGSTATVTAVGKSTGVSGSFEFHSGVISKGTITVDMTKLESDSSQRDGQMEHSGLQTKKYKEASFVQTEDATASGPVEKNKEFTITITGDLTLHGETVSVNFPMNATWDGKVIKISGELSIELSDYEIQAPDTSFVKVEDTGFIKIQLLFVPSS